VPGDVVAAPFADRADAGRQLAAALEGTVDADSVAVGLARGGVAVAAALARALHLPLTVLVVRKVGSPPNPELAIGAVSETGHQWIDLELCAATGASDPFVIAGVEYAATEARARRSAYGHALPLGIVEGRTAVVVDDGIATGATSIAALRSIRSLGARTTILATPVASPMAMQLLSREADRVVALLTPADFVAVGAYYDDFEQLTDGDVIDALNGVAPG
jgi:putative phosphoribosyl transferase